MSNDLADLFRKMKSDHEKHRDRLSAWKAAGGKLDNFPDGESIDDMIAREKRAVENLDQAIERLSKSA
tara:strand:- start:6973 stop:7176 length:204 start_codon:yes stop_codon:yes gene_type:complete